MITTVVRYAADLCERAARRFQGWADNLPDAPFEGSLLTAALAIAEKSEGFLSAEIDVPIERIHQYVEDCSWVLKPHEQKALARFFHRRGIYEVRLLSWFGWRGLFYSPRKLGQENADSLEAQGRAARIVEFQRGAGRRL